MRITFIGSGVGIYSPFEAGYRGFSCILVDGLLIDAPIMALVSLKALGLAISAVRNVAYTHAHSDHYHEGVLRQLVRRGRVAHVAAAARLCAQTMRALRDAGVTAGLPEEVPLEPFQWAAFDGMRLLPLPANHASVGAAPTLNFLVESGGRRLLYFVDSGIPLEAAVKALEGARAPADVLIMDATTVMDDAHPYLRAHGSLPSVSRVAACWRAMGILKPTAAVYGTHLGAEMMEERPPTSLEMEQLGVRAAEDGLTIEV